MPVIDEIAAERRRQVEVEGWTEAHDDGHTDRSLASAAACYASFDTVLRTPQAWPWSMTWWKPKGARRNLIRAAALIVAEIDERTNRS